MSNSLNFNSLGKFGVEIEEEQPFFKVKKEETLISSLLIDLGE